MCIQCPWRLVKGHWDPPELKLQVILSHLILTVESKPGSFGKAASAFKCWAEPSFAIWFYTKLEDQFFFFQIFIFDYIKSCSGHRGNEITSGEVSSRPPALLNSVRGQQRVLKHGSCFSVCFSYTRFLVAPASNWACREKGLNFWLPLRPECQLQLSVSSPLALYLVFVLEISQVFMHSRQERSTELLPAA